MRLTSENSKAEYQPWREDAFTGDMRVWSSLTWFQRLLYRVLLQKSFSEKSRPYLPNDDDVLWMLSGVESKQMWLDNKKPVLGMFKITEVEGVSHIVHPKVLEDWTTLAANRAKLLERKRAAGKLGGDARWAKDEEEDDSSGMADDGIAIARATDSVADAMDLDGTCYPKDSSGVAQRGTVALALPLALPLASSGLHENSVSRPKIAIKSGYILKDISALATKYFGGTDLAFPKKRIAALIEAYGGPAVYDCFKAWATGRGDTYTGTTPVSEWLKSAGRTLRSTPAAVEAAAPDSANLRAVVEQIAVRTDGLVHVDMRHRPALARLAAEHSVEDVLAAWSGFWMNRGDDTPDFAVRNFLESADSRLALIRNQRLERERIEAVADAAIERDRLTVLQEAADALAEERADEVD